MDNQKRIFTFDQIGEGISLEESKDAALSITEDEIKIRQDNRVFVDVILRHVEYNELKQTIIINVILPNGEPKAIIWPKECFKFHGMLAKNAPKQLIDNEMRKTVDILSRKKGKKIGKVSAYKGQLESAYQS